MSPGSVSNQELQMTQHEAARWITLIDSGSMSESERSELHTWLEVHRNARAMSEFRSLLVILQELPDHKKKLLRAISGLDEPGEPVAAKIALPPGYRLAAILRFLLTPTAFSRYVYPVISDMQEQYNEAIAVGKKWEARWIVVRQHLSIFVSWNWLYAFIIREVLRFLWRRH
jgi:ferric-dicitrate binding protein FerR (iron transport regulator)